MSTRDERDPASRTQAERSETTRAALLAAARELFSERGYAAVGTEQIVARAGVTRGALYHHFGGKRELFDAVFVAIEEELTERFGERILGATDPVEAMAEGIGTFLELSAGVQRITVIDAPAVLGWDRWREVEAHHGLGLLEAGLRAAIEAGTLRELPVEPLAHALLGALVEGALYVARAPDPGTARTETAEALRALLDGLRR